MELKRKMIDTFHSLPVWAQKELSYCDMGWEYIGNDIMGWDYIVRLGLSSLQKRLCEDSNFGTFSATCEDSSFEFKENSSFRIPSTISFYVKRINDLLSKNNEDLEVDAEFNDGNIEFSVFINLNKECIKLTGVGESPLCSAIDLFAKSVSFYEESYIPSLSNLEGVMDTFEDRNGEYSVEFKNTSFVNNAYNEYKRFCEYIEIYPKSISCFSIEKLYFKLKTVEGTVNVYTDYNKLIDEGVYQQGVLAINSGNNNNIMTSGNTNIIAGSVSIVPLGGNISGGYSSLSGGYSSLSGGYGNNTATGYSSSISTNRYSVTASEYRNFFKINWKNKKKPNQLLS